MSINKKVSILLPAYNRQHYLASAIESVLAQTYQNWELLISDNCSTDNSFEIAQKYARQDKRIVSWQNEKNIGPLPNYNKCIEKASGEYIELFGDDDLFETTCLEKLAQALDSNPDVVMSISAKRHIDQSGEQIREDRPRSGTQLIKAHDVIKSTIGTLTNWIISPVMYRAKYKALGFDLSLGIYADLDYWARMLKHGDLFYIDETLFNYRVHPGSETSRMYNDAEFIVSLLRIAECYPEYLSENPGIEDIHKPLIEKLMAMVDYATNYLKLNYDAVLKPLSNRTGEAQTSEAILTKELVHDLHDYKRIAYLALRQAVEIKKEMEWICEQYGDVPVFSKNVSQSVDGAPSNSGLNRENIRSQMKGLEEAKAENEILQKRIDELGVQLNSILTSQSWKITAPLRMMKKGMPLV